MFILESFDYEGKKKKKVILPAFEFLGNTRP